MSEENQAQTLRRWVDESLRSRRETAAPDDLDDDVREALSAIRPDRAPAARVTADDILASLTQGPLAGRAAGQVVQFPGAAASSGSPARRWWRSAGGAGGLGLLLAAAGVLYVFGIQPTALEAPAPPGRIASDDNQEMPPSAPAAAAVETKPVTESKEEPAKKVNQSYKPSPVSRSVQQQAPLDIASEREQAKSAIVEAQASVRALPAAELAGAEGNVAPDPGLAELEDAVAVGDEGGELSNTAGGYFAEEPPQAAAPPPARQTASFGWAEGLDGQVQARFDAARGQAQTLAAAGRYGEAAATLSAVVTAPARAGMYHAALAADYWLQAGDPDAAIAIAMQGLQLSSVDSPERSALLNRLSRAERAQPKSDRAMESTIDDKR